MVVASIFAAAITGWLITLLVLKLYCDGFSPNWFCSGHGGAWMFLMIGTVVVMIPVYFYLFRYIHNSDKKDDEAK